jgi:hypothetical protein
MSDAAYYEQSALRIMCDELVRISMSGLFDPRPLLREPYRSNWRILHVDGFEDGKHICFNYPDYVVNTCGEEDDDGF